MQILRILGNSVEVSADQNVELYNNLRFFYSSSDLALVSVKWKVAVIAIVGFIVSAGLFF